MSNGDIDAIDRLALNVGGITRFSRRFSLVFEAWLVNIGAMNLLHWGGPGVRYYRKINRVSAKNGAGAKTFDVQLFMSSLLYWKCYYPHVWIEQVNVFKCLC